MNPITSTPTYQAGCPCGCGQVVGVAFGDFATTTVTIAACDRLAASGLADYSVRKSQAPAAIAAAPVRHSGGLVVFEGGL